MRRKTDLDVYGRLVSRCAPHLRDRGPVVLLVAVLASAGALAAMGPEMSEYPAKAAFLYNITRFVEWPAEATKATFVVCVAPGSPMDKAARTAFAGKKVSGRPVDVRLVATPSDIGACQLLFIPGDSTRDILAYLKGVRSGSTLTVGETMALLQARGMLSIVLIDVRIELYVNGEAVRASQLQISPQLLRLTKEYKH